MATRSSVRLIQSLLTASFSQQEACVYASRKRTSSGTSSCASGPRDDPLRALTLALEKSSRIGDRAAEGDSQTIVRQRAHSRRARSRRPAQASASQQPLTERAQYHVTGATNWCASKAPRMPSHFFLFVRLSQLVESWFHREKYGGETSFPVTPSFPRAAAKARRYRARKWAIFAQISASFLRSAVRKTFFKLTLRSFSAEIFLDMIEMVMQNPNLPLSKIRFFARISRFDPRVPP